MDSPATSARFRFLALDGRPIDGPTEWAPALLEVLVDPSAWVVVTLLIQDQPVPLSLRRIGGESRVIADWPRSGPGRYAVRVAAPEGTESLDISIRPAKIAESAFGTLLADLETRLPAAVAIGLQRAGGLSGLTILPPAETTVAEEVARLRRAVYGTPDRPGIVQVLRELATDPHHTLRSEPLWVRRDRARRPHATDLIRAVAQPRNLAPDRLPVQVIDRRVERTVDLYENRLVRLFTDEVHRRLRRVERVAGATGIGPAQSAAQAMQVHLTGARREASFLDEVTRVTHLPTQVTMVLLNRPPYRAALEGYLDLHRSLAIRLEEPRLDAPLENLPALYQLWGTLQVIAILLDVAITHGYRLVMHQLVHRDASGAFVRIVPGGTEALVLRHPEHGTEVRLTPDRSYGGTGSLRSISYTQRPDITVQVRRPGALPRLYLFDPKYKLAADSDGGEPSNGRPSKTDIDKMHAYRDAIRDTSGARVVVSAATLYPGPTVPYGHGIEAIQSDPDQPERLTEPVSDILQLALRKGEPTTS